MHHVTALPHKIIEEQGVEIPLSDGTRLAARIWRPDSGEEPVPAILEFIPYRQRDLTAQRDSTIHPYLAGHGYACARVDLRGSGDSEGVLQDEYLEQELCDAEEVLAWLAAQPWCSGRTGMMGISWGGFNALQVAARRPESLGAIVTLCSTDDRYADDVHYMGGCLLGDNLSWASTMFAYTACPPDPAMVGERWREMWQQRIDRSGLWLDTWLRHQLRDDYWRHGSVCEDLSAIEVPVMAVSGWADGYSNAVFRLMEGLDVPRLGLVGPWSHKYPHLGVPGPAIGFLQQCVRWWDRWLKGVDNDVMDEPMVRTWMQESVPPSTSYEERPGRWVGEPRWPSPRIRRQTHPLMRDRIAEPGTDVGSDNLSVESPLTVGQYAGKWCSYNAPPDLPYDQREDDGGSLVFDSEVLSERLEILGAPEVNLEFTVDRPVAMVSVRLSDVAPDGRATRVTYGLLNLTHSADHSDAEDLVPGKRYRVSVPMNGVAQAFPPGHRLRVSVSTSYWPLAWPPPQPVLLTVLLEGNSTVVLPVRPTDSSDEVAPQPFGEAEGTPPLETTQVEPGEQQWKVERDLVDYESSLRVVKDLGTVRFEDIGLEVSRRAEEVYTVRGDDFSSPRGTTEWRMRFRRDGWDVETVTTSELTATPEVFYVNATLDAYENGDRVTARTWNTVIPRDHV
ncbi:CocE/NonD family hydrolase [Streptomonospora sp. PA3]|uniref:CocE/NonD family hydrolase n=1 Tax=Streptomonospora sp. PA3 TaxID=2607326 RepID=UPI0012DF6E69|nr:CocE/NonD family hydrolase [Streptomonospora sp. PA3]MUL40713.1 CocE/NonD family hydrolase [Streptomonospora sp. PA3]